MIDNRTNLDVWVHGFDHVQNMRLFDAERCLNELVRRAGGNHDKSLTFYISHLQFGVLNCILKYQIQSLEKTVDKYARVTGRKFKEKVEVR